MSDSHDPAAGDLAAALDAHVALTRDLVEVSQREQAHLLAYEVPQLASSTDEKRVLLSQLQANEARVAAALSHAAGTLGVEVPTVTRVAERLPEPGAARLRELVSCLQALTATLHELQSVTLVHADRGSRFVRAYAALLRGVDTSLGAASGTETYTQSGKRRPVTVPGGTLARQA